MKNLSGVLAAVRVGGVAAFIELDGDKHPRGEDLKGKIILIGGNEPQAVEWATVALVEHGEGQKGSYHKRIASVEVPAEGVIKPCGRLEIPFSVPVPLNARITEIGAYEVPTSGCTVNVVAHLTGSMDARARTWTNIAPERALQVFIDALETLEFSKHGQVHSQTSWRGLFCEFKSGSKWQSVIQSIDLRLKNESTFVLVDLTIHLEGHDLKERIASWVGSHCTNQRLHFGRAQLQVSDQGFSVACQALREALEAAVGDPGNPAFRLLHPADKPAEDKTLLRPACKADANDDSLLRPADQLMRE